MWGVAAVCHTDLSSKITTTNMVKTIAQVTPSRATSVTSMELVAVNWSDNTGVQLRGDERVTSIVTVVVDCSEHGVQPSAVTYQFERPTH